MGTIEFMREKLAGFVGSEAGRLQLEIELREAMVCASLQPSVARVNGFATDETDQEWASRLEFERQAIAEDRARLNTLP